VNRVDPTGMEWYTKAGGSTTDYLFITDLSEDPYFSGGQRYNFAGETVSVYVSDDGKFTTFRNGDEDGNWSLQSVPELGTATTTAINLSLYANSWNGNSGQNSSGQNGDNRFSKLPASAGMITDITNTIGATVKLATPLTEIVLRKVLTRPTTVAGAALAILPAVIDGAQNGNWTESKVYMPIILGVGALGLEYFGVGEAYDGISLLWSIGTVVYDGKELLNQKK